MVSVDVKHHVYYGLCWDKAVVKRCSEFAFSTAPHTDGVNERKVGTQRAL